MDSNKNTSDRLQADFDEAVQLGHEPEAVNVSRVLQVGAALAVVVVVAMILMVWLINALQRSEPTVRPATALPPVDRAPPSPRLDPEQPAELQELRKSEERTLQGYSWIDAQQEVARIPIERAMQIMAEKDKSREVDTAGNSQEEAGR